MRYAVGAWKTCVESLRRSVPCLGRVLPERDVDRLADPTEQDGPGRPMGLDPREVVNAILYIVRTGCQWENLPTDLPNANSMHHHHRKWCLDERWRTDRDRDPEPTGAVIDSQSVETTESGAGEAMMLAKTFGDASAM
jgi:transposase